MYASRTSIEDNKIMETTKKGRILAAVSTDKLEPWSANKYSEKDALVKNSGQCNSRFKIYKYYIFINMCQMKSISYINSK